VLLVVDRAAADRQALFGGVLAQALGADQFAQDVVQVQPAS